MFHSMFSRISLSLTKKIPQIDVVMLVLSLVIPHIYCVIINRHISFHKSVCCGREIVVSQYLQ